MLRRYLPAAVAAILFAGATLAVFADSPKTADKSSSRAPKQSASASEQQPKPVKAFDLTLLDRSVDPCQDFYRFSCGGWIARNPIPPDQAVWGRFNELSENNLTRERQILEKASVQRAGRSADEQKIGDEYASCMDEPAIEKKGLQPLAPEFERIAALQSKADLPAYLAHAHDIGVNAFFEFGSQPDYKDATRQIAETDQAGLGLPDRDYYLRTDARSIELRDLYVQHIGRMLTLAAGRLGSPAASGLQQAPAVEQAKVVLAIETALAKASMDRVSRRDPSRVYHWTAVSELVSQSPAFDWKRYFASTNAPAFDGLNVTAPDFVKGLNDVFERTELNDIKSYLRWRLLSASASILPKAFVDESFAFYGKTLTGARELRARWKRCVRRVDGEMGEALGKFYVADTFGTEGKQRVLAMVREIEQALSSDIQGLPWMTEETRKQALVKLSEVQNKIGFPDRWRDYSALEIVRGDALGNAFRANQFETRRQLRKIGNPVDRNEWSMSPPTVNAYYNPLQNNINFPAGILQPPFFDRRDPQAVNLGGIGAVIGHELTHGFDDQGRQFDGKGNLRNWWTDADAAAFKERAQCFVDQYGGYTVGEGVHLNGQLTLGENTADNGGARLALMALLAGAAKGESMGGFTPEQQFFLSFGQIWCTNITPEAELLRARVDPHSPSQFRVNGVLSNMPEFQKAFACKPGSPMVREKPCRVW